VNAIAPIAATRLTEDILPPDVLNKLKPEFVAPMVMYLCSEQCPVTGAIYNAGMGCFSRAAIVTGPAVVVGDGLTPPTPEQIHGQWDAINSLDGAVESHSATEALGVMLAAFEPKGKTAESPATMTVGSVFDRMPESFLADKAAGLDVVFQYRITGARGGEWFVSIKDGTSAVGRGIHQKPTTTIIMTDEDFLAFISRKLNATQAYTSGKLKIEGDLMKSQLIEKLFKF
jgi:putative sterol carrier protein